ncbi:MAG: lateral flagellar hook-basal body complex protein LfiE, partial [Plesiomonas shigelloides]
MKIQMMSSQVTLLQQMQEMQRVASQTPSIESNDLSGASFTDAMRDVVGRVNEQQNVA